MICQILASASPLRGIWEGVWLLGYSCRCMHFKNFGFCTRHWTHPRRWFLTLTQVGTTLIWVDLFSIWTCVRIPPSLVSLCCSSLEGWIQTKVGIVGDWWLIYMELKQLLQGPSSLHLRPNLKWSIEANCLPWWLHIQAKRPPLPCGRLKIYGG